MRKRRLTQPRSYAGRDTSDPIFDPRRGDPKQVDATIWDHIRAHSLQDPADKRVILAGDKRKAVFGQDKATMFEMNKLLSPHLAA